MENRCKQKSKKGRESVSLLSKKNGKEEKNGRKSQSELVVIDGKFQNTNFSITLNFDVFNII